MNARDETELTTDRDARRAPPRPRTLLICHEGAELDRVGLARWLASFSDLRGVVVLKEKNERARQRVRRELKRVGLARFPDVLAFRLYYKLLLAAADRAWERGELERLRRLYEDAGDVPTLVTHSPNAPESEEFIRRSGADIVVARCKTLLKESVFSIPSTGTFVMHPGVCPEYRNAHGCFWALASGDAERVGMTLLKIDRGVDTGPVYGYYTYDFDERTESHVRIQHRVVLENLDRLRDKLLDIHAGRALPLDTRGRRSATWGQPWLTSYLRWKRRARRGAKGKADGAMNVAAERARGREAR
ncbi:MAG TPA: formyltransferase family protein [Pyrinomonadaceae bacterium]|nr:formyltransferase family protein [Pyrinomonadaceae bacterium]